jgi:hypothetical protein
MDAMILYCVALRNTVSLGFEKSGQIGRLGSELRSCGWGFHSRARIDAVARLAVVMSTEWFASTGWPSTVLTE